MGKTHRASSVATMRVNTGTKARHLPVEQGETLIEQHAERPWLGIFGEPRVNVLAVNLKLDDMRGHREIRCACLPARRVGAEGV